MVRFGVNEDEAWIDYTGNTAKVIAEVCVGVNELLETISKDSKIDLDYLKAVFVTAYKEVNEIPDISIKIVEMVRKLKSGD